MNSIISKLFCNQKLQGAKARYAYLTVLCMATSSLLGDASDRAKSAPKKPKEIPDDYDLFRKDDSVIFATGDLLIWTVDEGALDYAVKMNHPAWSATNTFAVGRYQNATFDWSPGLRLALGWFNAPKFWDISVQYTFLPSYGKNRVEAPTAAGEFLNGTWAQPDLDTGPVSLSTAHSRISFKYHVLDLLFSRRFHTNEHLRINVFGGLTSAFIYQHWKIFYTDLLDRHSKLHTRWQFEGMGLRIGSRIDWFMRADFYLTGLASGGILSGWYINKINQTTSATVSGGDNSRPIRNTSFHDNRLAYTAQIFAGPSWQKNFGDVRLEFFAGYEFTIWTNLHEVFRSSQGTAAATKQTFINNSNISMQGVTLRTNVNF